jgi:hypothetical protein
MLHHDHRSIGGYALNQCGDRGHVLVAHAGRRLIEEQYLRIERNGGGNLQGAFTSVWQLRRFSLYVLLESYISEQLQSALVQCVKLVLIAPEAIRVPAKRCSARRTFSRTVRCGKVAEI